MAVVAGRKMVRNFSSLAMSQAFDRALRFVAYSYLARVLGVENFGMNSFAYSTFLFFGGMADFGARILGTREIATHRNEVRRYASNLFTMKLVFVVTAFVAMQIFMGVVDHRQKMRVLGLIYGVSLLFDINMVDWILLGLEEMHLVGLAVVLRGVLSCGLLMILVSRPEHLVRVAAIESGAIVASAVALFIIASRAIGGIKIAFDAQLWRHLWKSAVPLGFSLMLFRLFATVSTLILGVLESDSAVGLFRAASMIPNFLLFVALSFADSLLPVISRFFATDRDRLPRVVLAASKVSTMIGVPIAVAGVFLARPIITLVFGEGYVGGVGVFQLMIFSSVFVYSGIVFRHSLPACHKQRLYLTVMIVRTGTLIVLCVSLVPWLGVSGAAIAFLLAEVNGFLLSLYFFQRHIHRIREFGYYWKALVSGIVMSVVLGFLGIRATISSLLLVGSTGISCYAVVFVFVLKGISPNEARFLRNLLRQAMPRAVE